MKINVPCKPRGWLFGDLQRHFVRCGVKSKHEVTASDTADPSADAWIYLRSAEAADCPDLSRAVVTIHDLLTDPPFDYGPTSPRGISVRGAGALSFTHEAQWRQLDELGLFVDSLGGHLGAGQFICRPIGALEAFTPRTAADRQDVFTVGWSGRPVQYQGRELKRIAMFVEAVELLGPPVQVLMLGEGLSGACADLLSAGALVDWRDPSGQVGAAMDLPWEFGAPALYRQMDAFVSTSESPAVPLGCYEALASGVPVVSTPREWVGDSGLWVFRGETAEEIAEDLDAIRDRPAKAGRWIDQAAKIAKSMPRTLECWCRENTELAAGLRM